MKLSYTHTADLPDVTPETQDLFYRDGTDFAIDIAESVLSGKREYSIELSVGNMEDWGDGEGAEQKERDFIDELPEDLKKWLIWDSSDRRMVVVECEEAAYHIAQQYVLALRAEGFQNVLPIWEGAEEWEEGLKAQAIAI